VDQILTAFGWPRRFVPSWWPCWLQQKPTASTSPVVVTGLQRTKSGCGRRTVAAAITTCTTSLPANVIRLPPDQETPNMSEVLPWTLVTAARSSIAARRGTSGYEPMLGATGLLTSRASLGIGPRQDGSSWDWLALLASGGWRPADSLASDWRIRSVCLIPVT
jgi:hypothetical protein